MADLSKQSADREFSSQDLAVLHHVVVGIMHEIRNPVNMIKNFSEVVREISDELDQTLEGWREHLPEEVVRRLSDLARDLADSERVVLEHTARVEQIMDRVVSQTEEIADARL